MGGCWTCTRCVHAQGIASHLHRLPHQLADARTDALLSWAPSGRSPPHLPHYHTRIRTCNPSRMGSDSYHPTVTYILFRKGYASYLTYVSRINSNNSKKIGRYLNFSLGNGRAGFQLVSENLIRGKKTCICDTCGQEYM